MALRTISAAVGLTMLAAATAATAEPCAEWTVVTLARDGSWGSGSDTFQGPALASALRKCNAMSGDGSDCGAEFTAVRNGWTLGLLCGDHRVLVAATDVASAWQAARDRIAYLKLQYGDLLPECRRIVTIDPDGFASASRVRPAKAADTGQRR